MKKTVSILITILLITSLATASAVSTYSPELGMSMSDFVQKYNAIGSALNSSLIALNIPIQWLDIEGNSVTYFMADKNSGTKIFLVSADPDNKNNLSAGLDQIQIHIESASDFPALITIADKCASLFADNIFGTSLSSFAITYVISYYYENVKDGSGYTAYRMLDTEEKYLIQFWKEQSGYYFAITPNTDEYK